MEISPEELNTLLAAEYERGRKSVPSYLVSPTPIEQATERAISERLASDIPKSWLPILHTGGDQPCGKAAFYLIRPTTTGEKADLSIMRFKRPQELAYHEPDPTDTPQCSYCGLPINPYSVKHVTYGTALKIIRPPEPDPQNPRSNNAKRRRRSKAAASSVSDSLVARDALPPSLDVQPDNMEFVRSMHDLMEIDWNEALPGEEAAYGPADRGSLDGEGDRALAIGEILPAADSLPNRSVDAGGEQTPGGVDGTGD